MAVASLSSNCVTKMMKGRKRDGRKEKREMDRAGKNLGLKKPLLGCGAAVDRWVG